MKCKGDGCDRDAMYKGLQLCQKHYFRLRRTGKTVPRKKKTEYKRIITPNGYVRVHIDGHPLADSKGSVFEHRAVAYDSRGGEISSCELCGMVDIDWDTCHVDHIDENPANNEPRNLRVTCIGCNTCRTRKPAYTYGGRISVTYGGETKTPEEWSRDPRINITGATIRRRKKMGWSDERALFNRKITHHNTVLTNRYELKFVDGVRVRP